MAEQHNQQQQSKNPAGKKPPAQTYKGGPYSWLLIAVVIFIIFSIFSSLQSGNKISWSEFKKLVREGGVASARIDSTQISGRLTDTGMKLRETNVAKYRVTIDTEIKDIAEKFLTDNNVETDFAEPPWLWPLLGWLPMMIFVGLIWFFFIRNLKNGPGGMLTSFGRSRHRLLGKEKMKTTFEDVAGIDEAKEEVAEIIEFLKSPKKFQKIGGRIPRGVLLVGPPGCGKTLLAKAIAGQADVPFFSISGSDFVEMFVGVGASRVRDLFRQAKENSPCIIFLDEIDAIGKKRGPGFVSGGHDEREQTLNAILVEMDGFETDDQIIVMAATNRADVLDKALTRPGRFDRQVVVPLPDVKGRTEILKVHAKKVRMGPDIELARLARQTPMFSGADLEAIINEAAIAATMANKDYIEMDDLEEARDKVRWGRAKRSRMIDRREKEMVAFHEAGHALAQSLLTDADPLHKVSIIPRGPMGGATFSLPEKDRTYYTRKYCLAELQVCFGGRAAEELFTDDISSGAAADIQAATSLARNMITTWGMSDLLGPVDYAQHYDENYYFNQSGTEYSDKTAEMIDNEVRKLIDEAHLKCRDMLAANRDKLEVIANALIKYETLDAADVQTIIKGGTIDKPTVADLLAAEQKKS